MRSHLEIRISQFSLLAATCVIALISAPTHASSDVVSGANGSNGRQAPAVTRALTARRVALVRASLPRLRS